MLKVLSTILVCLGFCNASATENVRAISVEVAEQFAKSCFQQLGEQCNEFSVEDKEKVQSLDDQYDRRFDEIMEKYKKNEQEEWVLKDDQ